MNESNIHAIGIYPGGQSGNPGSEYYDNYINQWNSGEYINLNYTYLNNRNTLKGNNILFTNEN